jgi:hypothetical protein
MIVGHRGIRALAVETLPRLRRVAALLSFASAAGDMIAVPMTALDVLTSAPLPTLSTKMPAESRWDRRTVHHGNHFSALEKREASQPSKRAREDARDR